ncbi:reticulon-like protein B6 isoform X1 [Phoenix dactylifera]|uniref:Reticulon-like protein n=1 Tax=Phoenix dactylifera TaxID=42345 RepID=A0A8B9A929_PHODC|nr:reticulon-like protein B6 isoform X1 [Phoenix dactylifera]
MSEEAGEHPSITERITEKVHEYRGSSSSSDSDNEKPSSHRTRKKRLFGRKEPVHTVLGGGTSADIILWRNKQMSGSILSGVTIIWLLFEWMGYHLLTFICHSLIFLLVVSFIWSNAASFVNRSPPKFPEVILPEDMFLNIAHAVRYQINEAFSTFRYVASGKDLKQFLMVKFRYLLVSFMLFGLRILASKFVMQVTAGLWVVSVIGSWFSFLTLLYIAFLIIYTAPALYEKYEDQVDTVAGKAMVEINKHYAVLDEKVLRKIPRGPFADKKQF